MAIQQAAEQSEQAIVWAIVQSLKLSSERPHLELRDFRRILDTRQKAQHPPLQSQCAGRT